MCQFYFGFEQLIQDIKKMKEVDDLSECTIEYRYVRLVIFG